MKLNWKQTLMATSTLLALMAGGVAFNQSSKAAETNPNYQSIIEELTTPVNATNSSQNDNSVKVQKPFQKSTKKVNHPSKRIAHIHNHTRRVIVHRKNIKNIKRHKHVYNPYRALNKNMRHHFNYKESSMTIPYPTKLNAKQNSVQVSIRNQRAYIMQGRKPIYEFYISSGVYGTTPLGHFKIEKKGSARWFYNRHVGEGAHYAVSFYRHGLYLFHETANNIHRHVIPSIARGLGRYPTSHGCIHLSTPDARWFYYHAPKGMPVYIHY